MREDETHCGNCGYYLKNITKFLISHIGLVSLVVGYTIIGAFTFERLEADHELQVKKNMSQVRLKVTDDLWVITDDMRVLNEKMWADKVRDRLKDFERSLIKAIKTDGWDGSEDLSTQQWTFAGALFYSIILITTIVLSSIFISVPSLSALLLIILCSIVFSAINLCSIVIRASDSDLILSHRFQR
ncbi:hypothetical protein SK128_027173 [Halocaridina rubra]|uniref:Uncharacterized protein n=1 Tax=Halocaridina rubra TaxID=373956 RepID=A0AAN9AGP0_HALRR